MVSLALYQPEIPQNTGTLLRLGTCLDVLVHIIEPCGFIFDDRRLKRAGMDYINNSSYKLWESWMAFYGAHNQSYGSRLVFVTPDAETSYTDFKFQEDDILLLGRESDGFPADVLSMALHRVSIPMVGNNRSLNVAIAGGMVVGEALRQTEKFVTKKDPVFKEILPTENQKSIAKKWFFQLQKEICQTLEQIEEECCVNHPLITVKKPGQFQFNSWSYPQKGGGISGTLEGRVFEKAGVNASCVEGEFIPEMRSKIPGTDISPWFWASGISLVIHPWSPHVPAIHLNMRLILTQVHWFGGGVDLTPLIPNPQIEQAFHNQLKDVCDQSDLTYYPRYKEWCDQYFYLPHRQEKRGVGGIFYDNLNSGNWEKDFKFTQDVGKFFLTFYPSVVRELMNKSWEESQRTQQLIKRGRYVEFNLLYDRGTLFGLKTGGNIEAILMSLPPQVRWPSPFKEGFPHQDLIQPKENKDY